MRCQSATYFADKNALKGTLTDTLKEVQPTLFFGVPRVWEKIQEKMVAIGKVFFIF
jgi:long-chain-fatty-acid--CoA ligase ACSBG